MAIELTLLFLLLPLAVYSGWRAGRKQPPVSKEKSLCEIPADYLKGLNYLLNEQPDKAIEVFIQMLEVDSETVETHLALGSLFRRRGEVDRAIRIHQNLIARPTLTQSQRTQALYELGEDYMRAGLLDRAEALFKELIDSAPQSVVALRQLIDIYQQEKDWDKAIDMARLLAMRTGEDMQSIIAQFYCEMAEAAFQRGETGSAQKWLKRALASDRSCVRASMLEGQNEQRNGNDKAALKAYLRIEQQDADYLPEVITQILECYQALGRMGEAKLYLRQLIRNYGSITIMLALAELVQKEDGDEAAIEFITNHLHQRPSVRGMDRLINLNLAHVKDTVRDKLLVLKEVTSQLLVNKPVYKCRGCGFSGKSMHWQCPSCRQWNTVKPIQGVEGE
ncbi:MAG: lipopolysaccharide assembly protein LapB [Gammaproteobacteria bacterium]